MQAIGQRKVATETEKAISLSWTLKVTVGEEFEECLEFGWEVVRKSCSEVDQPPQLRKSVVELVLNLKEITSSSQPIRPPKNATVKRVEFDGTETQTTLQNMPEGRNFFLGVVGTFEDGSQSRSPWVAAATLSPDTRDPFLGNLDPMDKPRLNCKSCPCVGYIPGQWNQFAGAGKSRCRRCGCRYDCHVGVDVCEILHQRERKAKQTYNLDHLVPLPKDAVRWEDRECNLWFLTRGEVHPRKFAAVGKAVVDDQAGLGGPYGVSGKSGRVSVVTPTMESRQRFHSMLWKCFEAQEWSDKELVIVETYVTSPSEFFEQLAAKENRLTYVSFKVPMDRDWSIGLKRNIGVNLATGEFIGNFDDDDLYASTYLSTMVGQLEYRKALAVTLSSWYIFVAQRNTWSFCDTIAWGLAQGMDENAEEVRSWAYGYGFSYVYRRRASLEVPHDDINMGEDYAFISNLQRQKGDRSVQLVHDGLGICAHVQHGGNTSNTFPIRDADPEEIVELDVASLARLVDIGLPSKGNTEGKLNIRAHMTTHMACVYDVKVKPGCTVKEFICRLGQVVGCSCHAMKLHLVPPPGASSEQLREDIAARVLGIEALMSQLARTRPAWNQNEQKSERRRLMLERVKSAMRKDDRIPLSTTEVWLARPEDGAEAEQQSMKALQLDSGMEAVVIPRIIVDVELQVSDAKAFQKRRTIRAMMACITPVNVLRSLLHDDMPSTSRIFDGTCEFAAERPLKDSDLIPKRVIVTEFKGTSPFYAYFTKEECSKNLRMLKAFALSPETQKSLNEAEASACGNDKAFRVQLSQLLSTEAYPAIFRHYGVEVEGLDAIYGINIGMNPVTHDISLALQQLEVETLLRNRLSALKALSEIARLRKDTASQTGDFPEPPDTVLQWCNGKGPSISTGWTDM